MKKVFESFKEINEAISIKDVNQFLEDMHNFLLKLYPPLPTMEDMHRFALMDLNPGFKHRGKNLVIQIYVEDGRNNKKISKYIQSYFKNHDVQIDIKRRSGWTMMSSETWNGEPGISYNMANYIIDVIIKKVFESFKEIYEPIQESKNWDDFKIESVAKQFIKDYDKDADGDDLDDWLNIFAYDKKIENATPERWAKELVEYLQKKGYKDISIDDIQVENANELNEASILPKYLNTKNLGSPIKTIKDLKIGNIYVLTDYGMNKWIGELEYRGKKNNEHQFISIVQMDDFTMEIEEEDLIDMINNRDILNQK